MFGERRIRLSLLALVGAAVVSGALQGCREEEQDRILLYEKGVYQGPAAEPLAREQVDELRYRARNQRF